MQTDLKWEVVEMDITDLKDWKKNPRKLTKEKYEELRKSIEKYGFHDIVKIDIDNTIISGHQRKKILKELGIEKVKVIKPNRKLTEKEIEVIALKSNRHEGEFDFDILGNMFEMENLLEAGFKDFELGLEELDKKVKDAEVDIEKLGEELQHECPKCKFRW